MEIGITQYFNILLKTLGDVTKKVVVFWGKTGDLYLGVPKKREKKEDDQLFCWLVAVKLLMLAHQTKRRGISLGLILGGVRLGRVARRVNEILALTG